MSLCKLYKHAERVKADMTNKTYSMFEGRCVLELRDKIGTTQHTIAVTYQNGCICFLETKQIPYPEKCVTAHYISKSGVEVFSAPITDFFQLGSHLNILLGDRIPLGLASC